MDRGKWIALAIVLVIGVMFAIDRRSVPAPAQKPPAPKPAQAAIPEWRYTARAEREVRAALRDPDSATFSDVRLSRRSGTPVVCGRVNSRNGFGGMSGTQRFVSGAVTALEEQVADGEMDVLWDKVC